MSIENPSENSSEEVAEEDRLYKKAQDLLSNGGQGRDDMLAIKFLNDISKKDWPEGNKRAAMIEIVKDLETDTTEDLKKPLGGVDPWGKGNKP